MPIISNKQAEESRKKDNNQLIGIIVLGGGYYLTTQGKELKRVEILLNKTREDYAKRDDVTVAINRLEEKIDRILERIK